MIVIVDSGVANVRSVANMLRKAGVSSEVSADPMRIATAERLILPGIGHFDAGMRALQRLGLRNVLDERVRGARVPVLGICLGMQMLGRGSEEGDATGLGWLDAEAVRFQPEELALGGKVPHMGWTTVTAAQPSNYFGPDHGDQRFYFVHSYHLTCASTTDVLGLSSYGREFVSAVRRDNVLGVQFHPEKSHRFGLQLLRTFASEEEGRAPV